VSITASVYGIRESYGEAPETEEVNSRARVLREVSKLERLCALNNQSTALLELFLSCERRTKTGLS